VRRGWTEDELTIATPRQMLQEVIDDHAVEEAKVFLVKITEVTVVIEVSTFESVFQLTMEDLWFQVAVS